LSHFYIFLFALLTKVRRLFTEQPKEKVSQWFRKPYFVVVIVGILVSSFISIGVLIYSISQKIEKTKSVPVITIEVFECKEGDFDKCYNQIVCGPRRYTAGSVASSYGNSYFQIDGLPTHSLSFAWDSREEMRGTVVIKNQLLYVILVRTGSKNFRPVPEEDF